jgi:hypothetical protein
MAAALFGGHQPLAVAIDDVLQTTVRATHLAAVAFWSLGIGRSLQGISNKSARKVTLAPDADVSSASTQSMQTVVKKLQQA